MMNSAKKVAIALAASVVMPVSAFAHDSDQLSEALEPFQEQIKVLLQRIEELEKNAGAKTAPHAEANAVVPGRGVQGVTLASHVYRFDERPPKEDATETHEDTLWAGGAPEFVSPSGQFSFKPRGRIQIEASGGFGSQAGVDLPSGFEIRRARLGAEGQITSNARYVAEFEFANGSAGVEDLFFLYNGIKDTTIFVGRTKVPVILDEEMDDLVSTFIERSAYNVFAPGFAPGVKIRRNGANWMAVAGVFGQANNPGTNGLIDENWQAGARFAFQPILEDDSLIHIGVSGYYQDISSDNSTQLAVRPEANLIPTLINTGAFAANKAYFGGGEIAVMRGPFSVQGEYGARFTDLTGASNVTFTGGYAEASLFLTGEHRTYDAGNAAFGRVNVLKPLDQGGHGAIQLAARWSHVDLSDGVITGGEQDTFTVGLNWYLANRLRLSTNYIYFDVDDSQAALPFGVPSLSGNVLSTRAQVDW